MEILRIKLQKDLLQKCQDYKNEKQITDTTYEEFVTNKINELIKDIDFSTDTSIQSDKCMARLWNKGNGDKQCTHSKQTGDYCGKHCRMLKYDGVLRFGDIREEKPIYDLIKQKQGELEVLHWLHSDPIQQLQSVLDLQSQKIIYAGPHLITR